jgi:hypothetical protein
VKSSENILDVQGAFSRTGLLSRTFSGFEYRAEQVKMADAVRRALADGRRLAVEAGTGVGAAYRQRYSFSSGKSRRQFQRGTCQGQGQLSL